MKDSYLLYRKEGRTALVFITDNDDDLYYLLSKLSRTRNKELKKFAQKVLEEFFEEQNKN